MSEVWENRFNNLYRDYEILKEKNNFLQKELSRCRSRIEDDKEDIIHLLDIIQKNCDELETTPYEDMVLSVWQARLKILEGEENDK